MSFRRTSISLLLLLLPFFGIAQTWYNNNWGYRKAITIDYTRTGTGPHTNFPVLVSITDADLQSKALANGNDVLFTLSDGTTKLDHEIESYASGTGTLVAWVEIPSLSSTANTVIYMYYGYTSAASQQNVNGTWNTNYRGVWHLNNDSFSDATSTGNNAVNSGTVNSAAAKVAGGRSFATNGSYMRVPTSGWSASNGTVSLWINSNAFSGSRHQYIFGHTTQPSYANRIQLYTDDAGGNFDLGLGGSHTVATAMQAFAAGQWYYVTLTWSGGNYNVYVNGAARASGTYTNLTTLHSFAHIGKQGNEVNPGSPDESFDGFMDEVRVSNTARSAGWILTEYNNQNSPSTFYSIGTEQRLKIFTGTGNFSTAARWTGNSVPIAGDYLIIDGACTVDTNAGTDNVLYGPLVIGTGTGRSLAWAAGGTNRLNVTNVSAGSAASTLNMTNGGTLVVRGMITSSNLTFTPGAGTVEVQSSSTLPSGFTSYNNLTVNGSGITVTLGAATTSLSGNLTISSGTLSANALNISINGNWSNNGTFSAGTGTVTFGGGSEQIITQSGTGDFYNLTVNKSANDVALSTNVTVSNTLTLTSRCITLGSYNLTIGNSGSISGGSSTSFVVTDSTGKLIQNNVGTGGRTGGIAYPVGTATTSYTPVTITNTGTADNFDVIVEDNVRTLGNSGIVVGIRVVKKTWHVGEAVAGGSNVTLAVQWNGVDEGLGFNNRVCGISHFRNSNWDSSPLISATGNDPYVLSRSGITSFSPFAVEGAGIPLPVTLLYFSGTHEENNVVLTWATASERNNKGFQVEKSFDGIKFVSVGFVQGGSHSRKGHTYSFEDTETSGGTTYYRLKQIDWDGAFEYSKVIFVTSSAENTFTIYPNPVTTRVRIERSGGFSNETDLTLEVTSEGGGKLMSFEGVATLKDLNDVFNRNLERLDPGMYFAIIKANNESYIQKFIKK